MASPTDSKSPDDPQLRLAVQLSEWLDSRFTLPGTRFRFGLDPIMGLIPGLGDGLSMIFQSLLVLILVRHGASGKLTALLLINVVLDSTIGAIPVIGQIFDFFFKANQRNVKLTKEYLTEGKHQGKGIALWGVLILMIVAFVAIIVWLVTRLLAWVASWF